LTPRRHVPRPYGRTPLLTAVVARRTRLEFTLCCRPGYAPV